MSDMEKHVIGNLYFDGYETEEVYFANVYDGKLAQLERHNESLVSSINEYFEVNTCNCEACKKLKFSVEINDQTADKDRQRNGFVKYLITELSDILGVTKAAKYKAEAAQLGFNLEEGQ